jgi:hypothetical protein
MRFLFRTSTAVVAFVLPLALAALAAAPGVLAASHERTGAQIQVTGGAFQTFPAGQPFFVAHGWFYEPRVMPAVGKFRFSLTVDGVEVRPSFIDMNPLDDPVHGRHGFRPYVFNFPEGMTGTHVFTGTFFGPCQEIVDSGDATGPCANKNETTTDSTYTTTVTFT